MIYTKQRKRSRLPGGFFHLEEEKTKRASPVSARRSHQAQRRVRQRLAWVGRAQIRTIPLFYRFRDGKGRRLSGVSDNVVVTLRDEKGNTWKGVVD